MMGFWNEGLTSAVRLVVLLLLPAGPVACALSEEAAGAAQASSAQTAAAADTLVIEALADSLPPAEAARYALHGRDGEGKDGPLAKIGYDLARLYFAHRAHQRGRPHEPQAAADSAAADSAAFEPPGGLRVADGRVWIDATATQSSAQLKADLEALGLEEGAAAGPVVSGRLPVAALPAAARLMELRSMRPSRPATHPAPSSPEPPPGPAPSTARVRAELEHCEPEAYRCALVIRVVHAAGAATPVLTSGTQVEVAFPSRFFRAANRSAEALAGKELELTLQHTPAMNRASENSWRVVRLHTERSGTSQSP